MKIWTGNDNAFSVAILDKVNSCNNWKKKKRHMTTKNATCFANITINLYLLMDRLIELLTHFRLLKTQWRDQESNFRKYKVQIWNIFVEIYKLEAFFFFQWFRMRYHKTIPLTRTRLQQYTWKQLFINCFL